MLVQFSFQLAQLRGKLGEGLQHLALVWGYTSSRFTTLPRECIRLSHDYQTREKALFRAETITTDQSLLMNNIPGDLDEGFKCCAVHILDPPAIRSPFNNGNLKLGSYGGAPG